jgi:hypothetical protein
MDTSLGILLQCVKTQKVTVWSLHVFIGRISHVVCTSSLISYFYCPPYILYVCILALSLSLSLCLFFPSFVQEFRFQLGSNVISYLTWQSDSSLRSRSSFLSPPRLHSVEWWNSEDLKRRGSGPTGYYPVICLEGLRTFMKNLSQDSSCPGWDSNRDRSTNSVRNWINYVVFNLLSSPKFRTQTYFGMAIVPFKIHHSVVWIAMAQSYN